VFKIILSYKSAYGGYQLIRPTFLITFTIIKNLIEKAFKINEIKPTQGIGSTMQYYYVNNKEINEQFEDKVNSYETLKDIVDKLAFIINSHGIPFFEKYNKLDKVAILFASLDNEEQLQYISGFNRFLILPLIYKLANHPKFSVSLNEIHTLMKDQSQNHHVEHVRKSYSDYIKVYEYLYKDDLYL
jgi:hypothetical protein